VTVKVGTDSMTDPYVFHATGPAKPMKISLRQYNLPPEDLSITFYIALSTKQSLQLLTMPKFFIGPLHQAAHEARGSEDWSDALEFEYGAASG